MQYIIVAYHGPADYRYYGPFSTENKALDWASNIPKAERYWVAPLIPKEL